MSQTFIVEIIAIIVGLMVIGIETAIIIMLRKHMKILDKNHEKNAELFNELQKSIDKHLDTLNDHSKDSDEKLSRIFHEICTPIIKRQSDKRKPLKTRDGSVEEYSKLVR
jgi:hypothetical protein